MEDVEVAVVVVVVYEGSNVVEHQLCVGVEIPVQAEGDVVLLAAVGDVVLQINARESGCDLPSSGSALAEVLLHLGPVECGAAEIVKAGLAREEVADECVPGRDVGVAAQLGVYAVEDVFALDRERPVDPGELQAQQEIGRASCRERV